MSFYCLNCGKKLDHCRTFCSDICRRVYQESHPVLTENNPRIKRLRELANKIKNDFNCGFDDRRHSANLAKKTYYYIAKQQGYSLAESATAIRRLNHTSALHMLKSITQEDLRCIQEYIDTGLTDAKSKLSPGELNRIRLNFRYDKV